MAIFLARQYRVELSVNGRGEAELAPALPTYSARSMACVLLYPERGYRAEILLNGERTAACRTFSFAVNGDMRVEVSFVPDAADLPARITQFPENFRGDWKSADGLYDLTVEERTLILKKGGRLVETTLSEVYDPAYGGGERYFVSLYEQTYELDLFGNATALSLRSFDETVVFVPSPLPGVKAGRALYSTYLETPDSDDISGKLIVISADGFFWGDDEVFLLGSPKQGGQFPSLVLSGGRVYALFVCDRIDGKIGFDLVLRDPLSGKEYHYTIK